MKRFFKDDMAKSSIKKKRKIKESSFSGLPSAETKERKLRWSSFCGSYVFVFLLGGLRFRNNLLRTDEFPFFVCQNCWIVDWPFLWNELNNNNVYVQGVFQFFGASVCGDEVKDVKGGFHFGGLTSSSSFSGIFVFEITYFGRMWYLEHRLEHALRHLEKFHEKQCLTHGHVFSQAKYPAVCFTYKPFVPAWLRTLKAHEILWMGARETHYVEIGLQAFRRRRNRARESTMT